MLVVVIAVGGVPVAAVRIIDVISVLDRLVPAARPMTVVMAGMGQMRQRMLVVVPVMRRVRMTLVDVISMVFTLGARVPAARAVSMLGMDVRLVISGCHGSSLL